MIIYITTNYVAFAEYSNEWNAINNPKKCIVNGCIIALISIFFLDY